MHEEMFQIFDSNGNACGLAPRSRVHREGLLHCAANVFLFRSDGRLIVQRRQWSKDVCPGLWDLSVAEHLRPGETYEQGAIRGLQEELGVAGVALQRLGEVASVRLDLAELQISDHELQQTFRGVYDGPLRPDAEEVCELKVLELADLCRTLAKRPGQYTPWLRGTLQRLALCGRHAAGGS